MKKIRLFAAVLSFCLASSLASCASSKSDPDTSVIVNTDTNADTNKDEAAQNKENKDTAEQEIPDVPVIGGTDANGYIVTGVAVTDKKGEIVTDKAGAEVTEIAVVDNKGNIVTDPQGNNVKPQISNNNNNNNNNTVSQIDIDIEEFKDSTPSSSASGSNSVLWITNLTKSETVIENGKTKTQTSIKEVDGNGDIFTVTFQVSDDAPAGNYPVKFGRSASPSLGSFCGETQSYNNINYQDGNITVGSADVPETAKAEGVTCALENVTASAGSEVVMTCRLSGVNGLAAFNTYITYDSTYLKVTAINAGNVTAGKGDFMCQ